MNYGSFPSETSNDEHLMFRVKTFLFPDAGPVFVCLTVWTAARMLTTIALTVMRIWEPINNENLRVIFNSFVQLFLHTYKSKDDTGLIVLVFYIVL